MPEEAAGVVEQTSEPAITSDQQWFTEDYRDVVQQKGWASPSDAIKSYTELEKAFSSRVKMPTPESSAEEIRAFYQKTGCPENPEGYEIQVPEELAPMRDEQAEQEFRQIAHEMGISKQAFETIAKKYYDSIAEGMHAQREAGERQLREEFGDKYDENVAIAQRFAQNMSDEFREVLETSGLGNNPVVIKEFIELGKKTMGDSLVRGETSNPDDKAYVPYYKDSPEMYASGEDEESKKARAYFEAKGFKY